MGALGLRSTGACGRLPLEAGFRADAASFSTLWQRAKKFPQVGKLARSSCRCTFLRVALSGLVGGFLRSEVVATKSKKMQKSLRNLFSPARDGEGREVRRAAPAAPAQGVQRGARWMRRCGATCRRGAVPPALDAQVPRAARVELAGALRWTRCARAGAPLCTRCARWTRDAPRRARACGPARRPAPSCYSAGSASSTRRMSSCWLWTFVFL